MSSHQGDPWYQRRRRLHLWPLAVVLVLGLGIWGFSDVRPAGGPGPAPQALDPVDIVYRTLRLFTLNLDLPPDTRAPWQLWLAAIAAPVLTLRGIAELFREQLSVVLTQYLVRPRLVLFGANDRTAAVIAAEKRPGRWRDAIVVVDPDRSALATVTAPRVWTVHGDGTSAVALRRAAVPRAASVVIATGDDARNSATTTAVLDLRPAPAVEMYVEVADPGLAWILEQGGLRAGVETIPFSASAIGAAAVLDELEAERLAEGRTPLLASDRDGAAPTLALFGDGPLVDAVVLELHRRRRVDLLADSAAADAPPAPRIVLFGPNAERRRHSLAMLMGTESRLLHLDALDADLRQLVDLDIDTARHLARNRPLREIFLLTPSDLGGGIAITLARYAGPAAQIVLVVGSASTPFGDEIEEQAGASAALARVRLFRVPEHAYSLAALRAERVADRLGRALYESEHKSADPLAWRALPPGEQERYRERARDWIRVAGAEGLPLRRSAVAAPSPAELPLLAALGLDDPTALARAGLGVDFQSVAALVRAGRRLLDAGDAAAFGVWCEVARLHTDARRLAAATPDGPAGDDLRDIREVLLLRRAVLGDAAARAELADGAARVEDRPAPGPAIVLLGGPSDDTRAVADLLAPALDASRPDTVVRATRALERLTADGAAAADLAADPAAGDPSIADPAATGAAAAAGPAATGAAAAAGPGATDPVAAGPDGEVAAGGESARRQALGIWRALVGAGRDLSGIRAVALPGADAEQILLARALGATVGRTEQPGAPDLARLLLNGGAGVVPLPADRMTIRAFLVPSRWPSSLAALREPLAAELHHRYVARQRDRKAADDPALRPWSSLSPWLQRSNLALVDDIPNKLAAVGLRLDLGGSTHELIRVFEHVELLAEMEHGRFTAERLLSGWTSGVRDPARFLSPHLRPWTDLDEETKDYDREVVRDLPDVLAHHGVGVRPLER